MQTNRIRKRKNPFSQIPNALLNDSRISFKAKGLYAYMYSKPDNWNFTIKSIASQNKDGIDSVSSALKELKQYGWVEYEKHSDGTGSYYLLDELPKTENPNQENPNQGFPNKGKSMCINNKDTTNNKDTNNKDLYTRERLQDIRLRRFIMILKSKVPNEYKLKIKDISFDKVNSSLEEIENNNLAYQAFLEILETQTTENIIETYLAHIEAEQNNQNGKFVKGLVKFLLSYHQVKKSIQDLNVDSRPLAVEYINGLIEDYHTGENISWMDIKVIEKKYRIVAKSMLDTELNRRTA